MMNNYLIINLIGKDQIGIANQIIEFITNSGCNIIDSNINIFGEQFTATFFVYSNSINILKLENNLPLKAQSLNLLSVTKITKNHLDIANQKYKYLIQVPDSIGIIKNIISLFKNHKINIQSLNTKLKDVNSTNFLCIEIIVRSNNMITLNNLKKELEIICSKLSASLNTYVINDEET
ncbi:hypothetical protein CF386_01210 [Paraphotobacterium marinum]|uniref:Glycine cleavage system transcriptional repressor n=2 Tax=Paraphotobacterium marinum TaxID=1755811 RepID=A0A220VBY7_9GAMM|nr:ACT domain-containing protein [Paraphotobacterium marinum]ASK77791.1 hypothetical protein CF386_01210 [Paraphotobacterium marinum]